MAWLNMVVLGLILLLVAVIIKVRRQWQPHSNALGLRLPRMVPPDSNHGLALHNIQRERPQRALQATGLLNEACLRLVSREKKDWKNRAHSFGAAARLIRETMVDHARGRWPRENGGLVEKFPLNEAYAFSPAKSRELVELDDALRDLEQLDPQQGQIVELRYFGGLTVEETAEVLGISPHIVERDWSVARAWLHAGVFGTTRRQATP
jgi:RNA polymerase sigma factor (TIGR02999 family)